MYNKNKEKGQIQQNNEDILDDLVLNIKSSKDMEEAYIQAEQVNRKLSIQDEILQQQVSKEFENDEEKEQKEKIKS